MDINRIRFKGCKITTSEFFLKTTVVFMWILGCLLIVSCKQEKTKTGSEEKQDAGIHEEIERGPATVTLDVDKKEITIADRLTLTIGVTVDEDYDIQLPAFGEKLEQFGIVDYHTTQPKLTEDNRKAVSRTYILEPFLSGEYPISPLAIKFWKKGEPETDIHEIKTREISIEVKSLLPEDLKDVILNEIKPPVTLPRSYILWLWVGAGAMVLMAGTALTALMVKRRKKTENAAGIRTAAHELAYEALRRLVEEDLIAKGEIKGFYRRISNIIRRYIENRFGLRAPEQTTEEFLAGLDNEKDFPDQYKGLLRTFLRHCDLVKFAEYSPSSEDIQNTFDSCKAFIQGTEDKE